jgi:hypothetical protein
MSELWGGADEGPSESAVTLQRAAGRLKLINVEFQMLITYSEACAFCNALAQLQVNRSKNIVDGCNVTEL